MSRMTRRNGDRIELLGYDRMIDAMDDLIAKVCDYEDEAEQRERGCDYCEPECRNCGSGNRTLECRPDQRYPLVCKLYRPATRYCQHCGRKLVD